ncbi:MAG TPA: N-acetyltransferase [Hypericibacter adhaerens]|uniref:GCN5 family N-acetyltransferase n=1 Tax=Hypericibacter adhaerens TaxID=2602016 RepID=A0A5J6MUU2_9PROT|nr:N-acetyltransferase [Hypericibacter adhaerens]QEX21412.1 GCN5 family N-acetyltransferase [Hypericibacter adhaerens]HWA44882.1 N-acetyltransferase [Hypericibacter adhaerens]
MDIRPEAAGDAEAIRRVTRAAFEGKAYSRQTEAAIIDALRAAGALTISLVAVEEGEILGHVAFSPVAVGGIDRGWYGLGPVAVRPDRQRQGIGQALIREGLRRIRQRSAAGVILVGDPGYYARFGFVSDPALRYRDVPSAYIQRLAFTKDVPSGEIAFHAAFDAR